MDIQSEIKARVAQNKNEIIQFMREICAIPSMDSLIGPVGDVSRLRCASSVMMKCDLTRWVTPWGVSAMDPRCLCTIPISIRLGWATRRIGDGIPLSGKIEDGLYARGACDEKGSTPGMVYGLAIARDLGLLDGYTVYYLETWKSGVTALHLTHL